MKRIILFVALIITSANATTITIQSATTVANATAVRDAWLASNFGPTATIQNLENFEGFGYGPFTQLATGPGTFSVMEGALPSVVAGLTDKPVIAVPTSVGYGTAFGGVAALLGMLNSCASNVTVVNIDNGFGAACVASCINRL